jgi:hypothetical protein
MNRQMLASLAPFGVPFGILFGPLAPPAGPAEKNKHAELPTLR